MQGLDWPAEAGGPSPSGSQGRRARKSRLKLRLKMEPSFTIASCPDPETPVGSLVVREAAWKPGKAEKW